MKNQPIWKAAVMAFALVLCLPAALLAGVEEDKAAIREALARMAEAFNSGDLDTAMALYTDDAIMMGDGNPTIEGKEAIRTTYQAYLAQMDFHTEFYTDEIIVSGDQAYEAGTYLLRVTDKASGEVVQDSIIRHMHLFKRDEDGKWLAWRMMSNMAGEP